MVTSKMLSGGCSTELKCKYFLFIFFSFLGFVRKRRFDLVINFFLLLVYRLPIFSCVNLNNSRQITWSIDLLAF